MMRGRGIGELLLVSCLLTVLAHLVAGVRCVFATFWACPFAVFFFRYISGVFPIRFLTVNSSKKFLDLPVKLSV